MLVGSVQVVIFLQTDLISILVKVFCIDSAVSHGIAFLPESIDAGRTVILPIAGIGHQTAGSIVVGKRAVCAVMILSGMKHFAVCFPVTDFFHPETSTRAVRMGGYIVIRVSDKFS